ncbi:MAG: hypothetical protein U9Q67_02615 [Patescibacteria group bacterium]|nr:hypothetical protein [Patescibacteria group bacterium]
MSLFASSRKIKVVDFHNLKDKISAWNHGRIHPGYSVLPQAISFSSDFWARIKEIYRHTTADKHERAVTIWWAGGEVILADSIRGQESKVNIPKQQIRLEYKRTSNPANAERVVTLNGKIVSKRNVSWAKVPKREKLRVQYLFNMHTHPPHTQGYSFFSLTDIKSFIKSSASITGLITDELWILMKTSLTPKVLQNIEESDINVHYLKNTLRMRVYKGEFGKSVITVQ